MWRVECLPLARLESGPVELQALALTVMQGRQHGIDPAYASEIFLTIFAHGAKLPLISLESVELQMALLLAPNDAEATEMVTKLLDQVEQPHTSAILQKLATAWDHNDFDLPAGYQDWCDCVHCDRERADMKKLLDDRHPGLANGIERLHASGHRVFAAVGGLHMTGPMALPRLMAARGFTVERLF